MKNKPNPFTISYLVPYRVHHDLPLPKNMRILATGFNEYRAMRSGENVLRIRSDKGNMLENRKRTIAWRLNFFKNFSRSFRDCDAFPLQAGEKFQLTGFSAKIIKVDETGRPILVHYEFACSLDDPSLIWLQWDWLANRYKRFELPQIGETVTIPGPPRRSELTEQPASY